ncbi:MAG: hypothetical protein V7603_5185 [Micromonosporaceae bacterium]
MTDVRPGTETAVAALLAEYAQLKDEQRSRIGFRDNLIYVNMAAVAAVGYAAFQLNFPQLLLTIPLSCVVLGWTYLSNDRMITQLGRYCRDTLAPRLATLAGDHEVLGWEQEHPGDRRRTQRRRIQLGVDVSAFCLPVAAVVVLLTRAGTVVGYHYGYWTWVMIAAAAVAALLLAWQFAVYSDIERPQIVVRVRPRRPSA